jgi:hypothetical protein
MNGEWVRTRNTGENIQDSRDCQELNESFNGRKRKLRRFYHKMNNPVEIS